MDAIFVRNFFRHCCSSSGCENEHHSNRLIVATKTYRTQTIIANQIRQFSNKNQVVNETQWDFNAFTKQRHTDMR